MFQELVWQIVNKVDTETARKLPLYARSPFLEMEGLMRPEHLETIINSKGSDVNDEKGSMMVKLLTETIKLTDEMPSPRVIKSHLPFEMLPPNLLDTCKVIFVCRNPKDCCVSFYHHYQTFPEYMFKGTFADYAKMFMDGTLEFGSYWTMLKVLTIICNISIEMIAINVKLIFQSAWKRKDHPNMKIMWYEDMKRDLIAIIKDVSKFIGYHMTELKVLQLDDHLYIDNFREVITEGFGDPTMRKFIRKGKVGDWKNYFNEENNKLWDKWIAENLDGTDIKLPEA